MEFVGSFFGSVDGYLFRVEDEGSDGRAFVEGGAEGEGEVGHVVDGLDSLLEDPVVDLFGVEGGEVPGF